MICLSCFLRTVAELMQETFSTGLLTLCSLLRNLQRVKAVARGLEFGRHRFSLKHTVETLCHSLVFSPSLQPDSINKISQWEKTTEQLRNNNIANNSSARSHQQQISGSRLTNCSVRGDIYRRKF